jgi:hypothetical protein
MPARVICGYIGANTRQACENRDACATAAERSSGSMSRFAFAVGWLLTVG